MAVRALAYLRVSTTGQIDNTSLAVQRAQTEAEILRRGWELTEVITDAGISGTRQDRPGWQRLLTMCRNGEADAVVVASFTRFARSVQAIVTTTDQLAGLGVTFVSIKENLDMSTATGRMMRTMLAGVAEFELEQIRERTMDGRRAAIRDKAGWPGGPPPIGWRLGDNGPEPDPQEREVLRIIREGFADDGVSSGVVAQRLTDAGLRPRRAAHWDPGVIRRTALNEVYWSGEMRYGATPGSDRVSGRVRNTKLGPDGQPKYGPTLTVSLPDPPWSREQYEAVVAAVRGLGRRSNQTQRRTAVHPLSGHIVMPCGEGAYGVDLTRSTKAGTTRRAYRCKGKRHAPRCSCSQIRAEPFEEEVAARMLRWLWDPEAFSESLRRLTRDLSEPAEGSAKTELAARQREYDRAVGALDRMLDLVVETGSERARERIPGLQAAVDEAAEALSQAQAVAAMAGQDKTRWDEIRRSMMSANTPPESAPDSGQALAELVTKYQIEVRVTATSARGLTDFSVHGVLAPGRDLELLYATGSPLRG